MTLPYPPPWQDLRTLAEHRQGIFPPPRKVGGKNMWRWKEVDKYLAGSGDAAASLPNEELGRITDATRQAASRNR
jgi:hypothetical protein